MGKPPQSPNPPQKRKNKDNLRKADMSTFPVRISWNFRFIFLLYFRNEPKLTTWEYKLQVSLETRSSGPSEIGHEITLTHTCEGRNIRNEISL